MADHALASGSDAADEIGDLSRALGVLGAWRSTTISGARARTAFARLRTLVRWCACSLENLKRRAAGAEGPRYLRQVADLVRGVGARGKARDPAMGVDADSASSRSRRIRSERRVAYEISKAPTPTKEQA